MLSHETKAIPAAESEVREGLGKFIALLTEEAARPNISPQTMLPPDYIIIINAGRYLPGAGKIIIKGNLDDTTYSQTYRIPNLELEVAINRGSSRMLRDDPLSLSLERISEYLDGNDVEVDTTGVPETTPAPLKFWKTWKEESPAAFDYRVSIYPAVRAAIAKILGASQAEKLEFVDLFGGDGEFLETLLADPAINVPAGANFHIIDFCQPALNKAKARLSGVGGGIAVKVHEPQDLTLTGDIFAGLATRPNFVTAIGGLCASVVGREDALSIADKVYRELEGGGVFILTGSSPLLLNAADFSGIGFRVEQRSIPMNAVQLKKPYQFYVLRK